MRYVGVDPGTKNLGWAIVDEAGQVVQVGVVRATSAEHMVHQLFQYLPTQFDTVAQVVVESQEYRHGRAKGNPNDLFPLANIAGVAAGLLYDRAARDKGVSGVRFVTPMEWKGSVPKAPHHRRLCDKLRWKYHESSTKDPYIIPDFDEEESPLGDEHLRATDWSEVLDAIGLALWLREQHHRRINTPTRNPHWTHDNA